MSRTLKGWALALGLIGLLLVVALAARGGHPSSGDLGPPREVPATLQDSLVTLLAIAYVVMIAVVLIVIFRFRDRWKDPGSRWLRNYVAILILMSLITAGGYWAIRHGHFRQSAQDAQARQQQAGQRGGHRTRIRPVPARPANFEWPLAIALAGLVGLAGILVAVRRRLDVGPDPDSEPPPGNLLRAVERTIEDLRSERDPRRAVIAAYAGMERALASQGIVRRASETPFEYVARVLRELEVGEAPIGSLTQLFEYAKFSPHEIDSAMKAKAIEALLAIRDDLELDEREAA